MDMDTLESFWWFCLFYSFQELIAEENLKPILSRMLTGRFALPWKRQRSSVCFTVLTCGVTLFAVCGTPYEKYAAITKVFRIHTSTH
jgi:hypothetical protein